MSLGIERSKVSSVMIGNEWVECNPGSFYIDAYEYMWSHDQGDDWDWNRFGDESLITCHGFVFERKADGLCVFGPMTSIQAVAHAVEKESAA
jgi:hypothetical protein